MAPRWTLSDVRKVINGNGLDVCPEKIFKNACPKKGFRKQLHFFASFFSKACMSL
jgi:hypothetical protein